MKELCEMDVVSTMIYKTVECKNITIFPVEIFYPFAYINWPYLFDPSKKEFFREIITNKNSSTVHLWNGSSKSKKVIVNKGMPYEDIVQNHCPKVYDVITNAF